jgi:GT2 family glycosyltransferase
MREQDPQISSARAGSGKSLQLPATFSEARHPRALLITINTGHEDYTKALVVSLSKLDGFLDLSVLIVDNASGDAAVAALRKEIADLTNVRLLVASANLGYFGAARFGAEDYISRGNALPDWLIVCNNDVLIDDKEFLEKLFRHDPLKVGVIGPRIQTPLKAEQNPYMQQRPGWKKQLGFRLCSSNYGAALVRDWLYYKKQSLKSWIGGTVPRAHPAENENAGLQPIYAAHGSFMIFSRKFLDDGGYFDENLFLNGEEISVAEICRSLRLPVVYDSTLSVQHYEHVTVGAHMTRSMFEIHRKSMRYVLSTYLSGRECQ